MNTINFEQPCSIHFIGIGGISMSALAELLVSMHFRVSGSDRGRSPLTTALEEKGIHIYYGQRSENITSDIDYVVYTAAIREDNPEYRAAMELHIPLLSRAELLGQLMKNYQNPIAVSGTHGKTTTTAMISEIFLKADTNPTLLEGGILKSIGGNLHIGGNNFFVTEACEYTNSFLRFFPKVGLILNVEEDHLDFFKDIHDIRNSFHAFAQLLPEDGCLIINGEIDNYTELTKDLKCKIVTFGTKQLTSAGTPVDYYPDNISYDALGHSHFTLRCQGKPDREFSLTIPGLHNICNAMAAICVADLYMLPKKAISDALVSFKGADRRFEYKGTIGGVTIIDDYSHHPSEITSALTAAKSIPHNTLWCIFQPHTYTRTKSFMKDFAKALALADKVILADIYAARETDNLGISSRTLQAEIQALDKECYYFPTFDEIENFILKNCINNDMLITMGAGDVHIIGEKVLGI